jgi:hypothetical protein
MLTSSHARQQAALRALTRAWIRWARLRQRLAWRRDLPREDMVRRLAAGKSFADVGAMWSVHGGIAFLAEESGATSVTAVDVMAPTPEFEAEHSRRGSRVRFVGGDLHEPEVIGRVGRHQVVWCSGVLYHAPHPLLTLEALRGITDELLILATETLPEVPGLAGGCVFLPGLSDADRRVHGEARPGGSALGIDVRFDRKQSYGAWWWGISRSALHGMLHASGFEVIEEQGGPLHATVVARPV